MRITPQHTDAVVLQELASRLERRRIDANLTQADLAKQAGVSKRTIERIESGHSTDFALLIRTIRVLGLFDQLDQLIPDLPQSPMSLLKQRGRERKRVGRARLGRERPANEAPTRTWKWGE